MDFKHKKILLTGGSSGIGKALLAELHQKGARNFAIVGRNLNKMQALKPDFPEANFLFLQGDLGKPEEIKAMMSKLTQKWDSLDILINNAGVVSGGAFEDMSDDDIIAQQNINVTGLLLMTKHALPLLQKSKEAVILNVSSGLGLIGLPFYVAYATTKAAVHQFSEALRRELKDYPIHVMTIYPTGTETPMMETAKAGELDSPKLVAKKSIEGMLAKEIEVVFGGEQRLKDRKSNFEDPLAFDREVEKRYESLKKRATGHRAM